MSDINTGGQAFPDKYTNGMTLRDYFAAKAMPIFMAEMDGPDGDNPGGPTWQSHQVAELAYEVADAMLKARES